MEHVFAEEGASLGNPGGTEPELALGALREVGHRLVHRVGPEDQVEVGVLELLGGEGSLAYLDSMR